MMIRGFLLVLFSVVLNFFAPAQNWTFTSKKAQAFFKEASHEYALGNLNQAEVLLLKTIKADINLQDAYFLLATIKNEAGLPIESIEYYSKGLAINPNAMPIAHYYLAKVYFSQGNYTGAQESFYEFLSFENISQNLKEDAELQSENCSFALEALKNPLSFKFKNLGITINSANSEYFPTMTVDNQFLLFTRRLNDGNNQEQEDFFGVFLKDSLTQKSFPITGLNTPYNEGASCISADGKTIIFTACEKFGNYGHDRKGYGSCDLFYSKKVGNHWIKAVNLGSSVNTANWESQPSLSSDGRSLYFVRAPKKSFGNSDILRSDKDENGEWKTPVKLNSNINTNLDEQSVFIHPDSRTLYFSSNGHIGMGGADLYFSKWDNEIEDWGKAINLGCPINTHNDESSIMVAPDGKLAYFATEREDGFGGLDIYSFELPESIQPEKITYLKGVVFDKDTKEFLNAEFELIDLESGKQIIFSNSDSENGSFLLTLNLNRNYLLNVSKQGYLFYSDQFLLKNSFDVQQPFIKNIPLQAIALGKNVVLKNIFFAFNESKLVMESEIELNKLILFLNNNPEIHIEIQGHTDNIGTTAFNLQLSRDRAKAVYEYLIEHQIDANRLKHIGFGFEKPLAGNETERGRAQNRRTEILITHLK
jgi:outer membrane protein OmpA-like peptidoglycan-associated protein